MSYKPLIHWDTIRIQNIYVYILNIFKPQVAKNMVYETLPIVHRGKENKFLMASSSAPFSFPFSPASDAAIAS